MSYSKEQIAAILDLAVLKPTATQQDIKDACALANKHGIRSVCVAPCNVKLAASLFGNVSAVVGFPHGTSEPAVKYLEATTAMRDGARELDMVLNYGRFLGGDPSPVIAELAVVVSAAHQVGVTVKAILETCYHTPAQIREMCRICVNCGTDFVKTSTGFGQEGATFGTVQIMLDAVDGSGVQVKASGGIHHYAQVARYLDLGCTRIGASNFNELLP